MSARQKHAKTGVKAKGIASRQHASEFVFPDKSYGGNLAKFESQEKQIVAENRSVLLAALILVYMILFGHGLPTSINKNLF